MHNYPYFEIKADKDKLDFIRARCFGTLVIACDGAPLAAHIPLLLVEGSSGALTLEGHLDRKNPIAMQYAGPVSALAIFNGVDAYVSPSNYPSKHRDARVAPTWNYVAVQVAGTLETFTDPDALLAHVEALTTTLEADRPVPWAVSDAPRDFTSRLVRAITGVRVAVHSVEGIRKLSQNQRLEDFEGVRMDFENSSDLMTRQVAVEMAEQMSRDNS